MNNINEDNKLLAEFMGLELEETLNGLSVYARKEQSPVKLNDIKTEFYQVNELKYDTSCDWLMPVVDKIKILVMEDDYDEYNSEEWDLNITHALVQIEIKSVYKAVVEFIKNQNK